MKSMQSHLHNCWRLYEMCKSHFLLGWQCLWKLDRIKSQIRKNEPVTPPGNWNGPYYVAYPKKEGSIVLRLSKLYLISISLLISNSKIFSHLFEKTCALILRFIWWVPNQGTLTVHLPTFWRNKHILVLNWKVFVSLALKEHAHSRGPVKLCVQLFFLCMRLSTINHVWHWCQHRSWSWQDGKSKRWTFLFKRPISK